MVNVSSHVQKIMQQPLLFISNNGQLNADARFYAQLEGNQYLFGSNCITAVYFAQTDVPTPSATVSGTTLLLQFIDTDPSAILQGTSQAMTQIHYLCGGPSGWHTHLPSYEKLQYKNIWNGIDLTLTGSRNGLKFLWTLQKASCISSIRLQYDGAQELKLCADGSLSIRHTLGELHDKAPIAWQEIDGKQVYVACSHVLENNRITFCLSGEFDASAPLIIDPVLSYVTFLGGSLALNYCYGITADSQGCAYVTGKTSSTDFPVTPGAFQTSSPGNESVFVTKFTPDGSNVIYSTYIGGSSFDSGESIVIDSNGCAYLSGYTSSNDFPVTPGAFQTEKKGASNAFLIKLSPTGGSLIYSTLLGLYGTIQGYGVALGTDLCAYITGSADGDIPVTSGAFQTARSGASDVFVTKFSSDGSSLVYSTYLGGNNDETGYGIAVDLSGCAYVTGSTSSADFPVTAGAFQTSFGSGSADAFVSKLNSDGSALIYSTYLGGSERDFAAGIAVDAQGFAYVAGITASHDFPITPSAFQTVYGGGDYDAFVTRFTQDGTGLVGSTYLGGSNYDDAAGIAVDSRGRAYITGGSSSANYPITPEIIPSSLGGFINSTVSILSNDLKQLLVSYYLGDFCAGWCIALGPDGYLYTGGVTVSNDFPVTPGAFQTSFSSVAGATCGYVTKTAFLFPETVSITLTGLF